MGAMASQITNLTIITQPFIQGAFQRKHESSASLAFLRGIHRWPVNSPHKGPVTRKMFPFDDAIMTIPFMLVSWQGINCFWTHWQECHLTLVMINRHWFRLWLGAIRQQAISWINVGQFHDAIRHQQANGLNTKASYLVSIANILEKTNIITPLD